MDKREAEAAASEGVSVEFVFDTTDTLGLTLVSSSLPS